MKTLAIAALLLSLNLLGGCKQTRDAMINKATDSPDFQKNLVVKTRESCVTAADEHVPNRTPTAETAIHTYCDCVAVKGMGSFSHAELVELGVRGMGSLSPEQQAKMDGVVKACQEQAGLK